MWCSWAYNPAAPQDALQSLPRCARLQKHHHLVSICTDITREEAELKYNGQSLATGITYLLIKHSQYVHSICSGTKTNKSCPHEGLSLVSEKD